MELKTSKPFSSMQSIKTNPTVDQDSSHLKVLDGDEAASHLETIMELANLDSTFAGHVNSLEYNTLTKIVSVSRKDSEQSLIDVSDADETEHEVEQQPSNPELVQEPFAEIESENAHVELFKFLFDPIEVGSPSAETHGLVLSDKLVSDLQNLKDRMQHRYNVIKRNLFNVTSHE